MEQNDKNTPQESNPPMRLNKFISNAGICSRRKADEHIKNGQVEVNGIIVTEMGHKISDSDEIKFKGKIITREKKVYILLNKPKDYITTTNDESGRRTVMELVKDASDLRLYPVGRLDRNTTGLLLFTNDGDLTQTLTHPSNNVSKLYHVFLDKEVGHIDLAKIEAGLELKDGKAMVDQIDYADKKDKSQIGIQLHIGKNRIVRRIFEHLGYKVKKLDRVVYAGLTKKNIPRGKWRYLNTKEVRELKFLSAY